MQSGYRKLNKIWARYQSKGEIEMRTKNQTVNFTRRNY